MYNILLFQVIVFNKTNYRQIKDKLKTDGIAHISELELSHYFSPWYAEHIGNIKVASGNRSVANWTSYKLKRNYYFFTYPSLLKIHGKYITYVQILFVVKIVIHVLIALYRNFT